MPNRGRLSDIMWSAVNNEITRIVCMLVNVVESDGEV